MCYLTINVIINAIKLLVLAFTILASIGSDSTVIIATMVILSPSTLHTILSYQSLHNLIIQRWSILLIGTKHSPSERLHALVLRKCVRNAVIRCLEERVHLVRTVVVDIGKLFSSNTATHGLGGVGVISKDVFNQWIGDVSHTAASKGCCHVTWYQMMLHLHYQIRPPKHRNIQQHEIHHRLNPRASHHSHIASI